MFIIEVEQVAPSWDTRRCLLPSAKSELRVKGAVAKAG